MGTYVVFLYNKQYPKALREYLVNWVLVQNMNDRKMIFHQMYD